MIWPEDYSMYVCQAVIDLQFLHHHAMHRRLYRFLHNTVYDREHIRCELIKHFVQTCAVEFMCVCICQGSSRARVGLVGQLMQNKCSCSENEKKICIVQTEKCSCSENEKKIYSTQDIADEIRAWFDVPA
jgi:hypothetical protein